LRPPAGLVARRTLIGADHPLTAPQPPSSRAVVSVLLPRTPEEMPAVVRNRSNVRRDGREALPRLLARASGLDRGVPVLPEVRPGRQRNLATTAGERFESALLAAERQQDTVGERFGAAA
jgi:hypothetical protein